MESNGSQRATRIFSRPLSASPTQETKLETSEDTWPCCLLYCHNVTGFDQDKGEEATSFECFQAFTKQRHLLLLFSSPRHYNSVQFIVWPRGKKIFGFYSPCARRESDRLTRFFQWLFPRLKGGGNVENVTSKNLFLVTDL